MRKSSNSVPLILCSTLVAAGLALSGLAAQADVNLSTGLDAGNALLTSGGLSDAHWTVSEQAGGTGAAQTVYPVNADWFGGWLLNGPNSDWVARDANVTNNGAAPYTFSTTFDLTGFNPSTASLSGSWAIDDSGTLDLNGNNIATLGSGAWGGLTPFSVTTGSPFFNPGLNTLSITITSDDQFLEAVRLEGSLSVRPAVATPEPGSLAMILGMGLTGAGFLMRRRK